MGESPPPYSTHTQNTKMKIYICIKEHLKGYFSPQVAKLGASRTSLGPSHKPRDPPIKKKKTKNDEMKRAAKTREGFFFVP